MYTVDLPPRMRTTLGHKDRDKVLVLRSYAELVAFSATFGVVEETEDDDSLDDAATPSTTLFGLVRWGEVARDYGGVEVSAWAARAYDRKAVAANKENDPRVAWFDGWDVPSGCVWSGRVRWVGAGGGVGAYKIRNDHLCSEKRGHSCSLHFLVVPNHAPTVDFSTYWCDLAEGFSTMAAY